MSEEVNRQPATRTEIVDSQKATAPAFDSMLPSHVVKCHSLSHRDQLIIGACEARFRGRGIEHERPRVVRW